MRKMKRFAAVLLSAALLCPMTAYADNSDDARALYHQVEEKQKALTDMNAFADFKISVGGDMLEEAGIDSMNMRMEMNMKMNHMTDPQQMKYMVYARTTMDGLQEPVIMSAYYQDGWYYVDTMGQKIKMPMDVSAITEQTKVSTLTFDEDDLLSNFRLWGEGENKVVGFVIEDDKMNEYIQTVLSAAGMSGLTDLSGLDISDIQCEYVVDPAGNCVKMRMKLDMSVTEQGQTVTMKMDGDIGIADPGQPVEVPSVQDPASYQDMAAYLGENTQAAGQ